MTTQAKVRISTFLPKIFVIELKKVAKKNKSTMSSIFQKAVEDWFNRKLSKDAEFLAKIDFEDLPSEDEWNNIQIKI